MSMCGERGEREARGGQRRLAAPTFLSRENRSAKARRFPPRISLPYRWAHPPNPGIELGYVYGYNIPLLHDFLMASEETSPCVRQPRRSRRRAGPVEAGYSLLMLSENCYCSQF